MKQEDNLEDMVDKASEEIPRILLVEDETIIRDSVSEFFKKQYEVDSVESMEEARKNLKENNYDLVILDLTLPDGNGFELTSDIKKSNKNTGILVYSADESIKAVVEDMNERSIDYLPKTAGLEKLNQKALEVLNKAVEKTPSDNRYSKIKDTQDYKHMVESLGFKKGSKAKKRTRVIVIVGETASGKTTTALSLEALLNEKGKPVVYIGNEKTGEPRKGEIRKGRDKYISEEKANDLEIDSNFRMYKFLGRRYFSEDLNILNALRKNKDVILVRNINGLEAAEDLVYRYKDELDVELISVRIRAGEDVLKQRLEKRPISEEELEERKKELRNTMIENTSYGRFDISESTNRSQDEEESKKETINAIYAGLEKIKETRPNLHAKFKAYIRDTIKTLTDSKFDTIGGLEQGLDNNPIVITTENKEVPFIEMIKAKGNYDNGVYSFYLNLFYSEEDSVSKKKEFLKYMGNLLDTTEVQKHLEYEQNPASNYAKTNLVHGGNRHKIRTDDIALFSCLKEGATSEYEKNELHSVAFVCLEKVPKEGSKKIIVEGI